MVISLNAAACEKAFHFSLYLYPFAVSLDIACVRMLREFENEDETRRFLQIRSEERRFIEHVRMCS
jgi:hypothetical protein